VIRILNNLGENSWKIKKELMHMYSENYFASVGDHDSYSEIGDNGFK
jgi:hypothetical protein